METLEVTRIAASEAAAVMHAAGLIDPAGVDTPSTIAATGETFALSTPGGRGVFVTKKRGRQLWISGAGAVGSTGLAQCGLDMIEAIARQSDCDTVAFQTARPGLVRIAKKQGYRITGFILEKKNDHL